MLRITALGLAFLLASCSSAGTSSSGATPVEPAPTASSGSGTPCPPKPGAESSEIRVPPLNAVQMVDATHGWAVGARAIYVTADGTHWGTQHASDERFGGIDFVSARSGWAVGIDQLLATTDGGACWAPRGEPAQPLRSVHFASASTGWGVAGGAGVQPWHGWMVPTSGGVITRSDDSGRTWSQLSGPADAQTICFSDPRTGWLGTPGAVYRSTDGGQTWVVALRNPNFEPGLPQATLVECAPAPAAWIEFEGGSSATGHTPYAAYATADGTHWRLVLEEPFTMRSGPPAPSGPDSKPGSFSVVDPQTAVFVGDGPVSGHNPVVIAVHAGATLQRAGAIENSTETMGAAFLSASTGWVLLRTTAGQAAIAATTDGGRTWALQFTLPEPP
jgi:photosystem II stability/assembly factor-like uncharacterized protein